ncbi:MAG TPA: glycine cleavage system aminomethyltransferase GcvT [Microvirga sp.]|nr:glycine cleavage system aminomethyltransferase GcvT [Microvirga sp.]
MAEPVRADEPLLKTPLHAEHVALGARMVPFAGYDMPVQYPTGILSEHNWTREHAGLFDVSHMGQAFLIAEDKSHETVARALEALIPADVLNLKPNQQRYSQLLADDGGILDDLMVTRVGAPGHEGWLYLVVNASMKEQDYAHIEARLPAGVSLKRKDDLGLMALQGPSAETVLAQKVPAVANLAFMMSADVQIDGIWCHVSRSGYTGEDGFEISCHGEDAPTLWKALLADPEVKPIGLGARDSLRLEAGLCLYGHDIDTTTSPIEAGLNWSIQKRRREEGGFPGAERIQREIKEGPARVRVGIRPEGRAPAREGTVIATPDGREVGTVTSGGFGPTVNGPVAMGYVSKEVSAVGTDLHLIVRGKPLPAKVAAMPFAPHRYKR